jgi:putative hydroxymethylpyrimidine transport system substrate-binding protein
MPRLLTTLTALLLGLGLNAQALAAEPQKLTVMLDWFVNPVHAPLIIAKEKGYFGANGLAVEIVAPADPADPPKLVAAGKADLAISYQPQLHMQVDQGLPLMRVGTLVATPLTVMVTLADSGIRSLADLRGKKIGYSVGGVEEALVQTMLENADLSLDDVTMVNVNFSLSPALLAGQVDAVTGAFRNFELNQLALEGHEGRAFFVEESGVPLYDELIFVANRDKAADTAIAAFMHGVEQGTHFMLNHPDEAWAMFIKAYPDLDDELNRLAWRDTLTRFALRPAALDEARYARFADFMLQKKLISKVPPVSDYAIAPQWRP